MAVGDLSRVYFAKSFEASLGANAILDLSFLGKLEIGPKHVDEVDDNVNGEIWEKTITRTALAASGSFSGEATSNILAALFKYWMMARPTTTGAGDPYTHTWTDLAAGSPATGGFNAAATASFTMLAQVAGLASYIQRFDGSILPVLTLSGEGKGKIQFNAAIETIGDIVATTEPAVTLPTEGYCIGRKTTLTVGGTDLSTALRSWSVVFASNRKIGDRAGSTSGEGTSIEIAGRPSVEFTYTLDEQAVSGNGGWDDYAAGTTRAIILTLKGDTNRDTVITLSTCRLVEGYPIRVSEHGVYGVQRKVRALALTSATPDIFTVAIRNDVSAYT